MSILVLNQNHIEQPTVAIRSHDFEGAVIHTVTLDGRCHFDAVDVSRVLAFDAAKDDGFERTRHLIRVQGARFEAIHGTEELDLLTKAGLRRCLTSAEDPALRTRFRKFIHSTRQKVETSQLGAGLAAVIVERRHALGLSQSEVDRRLGASRGYYASLEHGNLPSLLWFRRLMAVLDLSADDVLGLTSTASAAEDIS